MMSLVHLRVHLLQASRTHLSLLELLCWTYIVALYLQLVAPSTVTSLGSTHRELQLCACKTCKVTIYLSSSKPNSTDEDIVCEISPLLSYSGEVRGEREGDLEKLEF